MRLYLILLFSFLMIVGKGQQIDSLWKVYYNAQNADTTKLKSLISIAKKIQKTNMDSALLLSDKIIHEAKAKKLNFYEAKGYHIKGNFLFEKNEFNKALESFNYSLELMNDIGNKNEMGNVYLSMYVAYYSLSNYNKALNSSLKALAVFESTHNTMGIGKAYNNIGIIYLEQKQYERALSYFHNALIFKEKNDNSIIATYNNIGIVYGELGKTKEAKNYFKSALLLNLKIDKKKGIAGSYTNLGNLFKRDKELDSMLFYNFKSLVISKEINDINGMLNSYDNISSAYNDLKQFDKAIIYATRADSILKLNPFLNHAYKISLELAIAYEGLKNPTKALEYMKQHISLKDSLFNLDNSKQLSDLKTNYEVEKKELELKEKTDKEKQRFIIISIIVIGLLLLIGAVYYFNQQKKKLILKHQSILLQQKLLRSQMNPHFLSNCVSAIQSLVLTQKPIIASDYLADLTQMTRRVLEFTQDEYVDFDKEIEFLNQYLKLNQLLFNNSFDFHIETNQITQIKIPCAIIQPFIENSIKHGISKLTDRRGSINIDFKLHENAINCTITDNGIGINNNNVINQNHQSFSIASVQERLQILSNKKQIIPLVPVNILDANKKIVGTSVTITIPYIKTTIHD